MATDPAPKRKKPSSWSRLPDDDEPESGSIRTQTIASEVEELPAEAVKQARKHAAKLASRLDKGVRRASVALTPPAAASIGALFSGVDLPSVTADRPLQTLAERLDREGDLWRGVALRALVRGVWADRFTTAVALLAALGCAALATVAAFGALFGVGNLWARMVLLLVGAVILLGGSVAVAWTSAAVRRAQRAMAREAKVRADLAELRLHRVALAMEARKADPELYREVLGRLEQDVSAPPG